MTNPSAAADLVLVGGTLVDGTGGDPYRGWLAVTGETITALGRQPEDPVPSARSVVDCSGLVVAPGFIDIHTHSDLSYLIDPQAPSKVVQGVTTEVVGNCGFSPFPSGGATQRTALREFMRGVAPGCPAITWDDLDGYAAAVDAAGPVTNVAPLVGHGALRIAAVGLDDVPIRPSAARRMRELLDAELRRGAFGLSTGLTYVPSRFADPAEIEALARVVRHHNGLYASHTRGSAGLYDDVDETVAVGRCTGVRVQFSHVALNDPRYWGRAEELARRFAAARADGVDVTYDVYPYDASASSMTQYLPGWLQRAGEAGLRRLADDRRGRARACRELAAGLFGYIPWDWRRVVLSLTGPGDTDLEGLTVAEAAARRGCTAEELCVGLCARHGNSVQVVLFYRQEADVARFVSDPAALLGSDGSALSVRSPGHPHPRSFGAHTRLFQRFVRDRGVLSLAQAVHMTTLAPARRLGLHRRGRIAAGMAADLVAFDLDLVRETATWTTPKSLATGVTHVWINGIAGVRNGIRTGAASGRVLRHTRD